MSTKATLLITAMLAAVALLAGADTALAAPAAPLADVGSNLNGWLGGLAKDLLIPIAGLFGIGALFRRDVGHALLIAVIAIVVGIFVYDAPGATQLISGVANTLTK
jgi:predicted lipid-binding transport protein (Tim44 family)